MKKYNRVIKPFQRIHFILFYDKGESENKKNLLVINNLLLQNNFLRSLEDKFKEISQDTKYKRHRKSILGIAHQTNKKLLRKHEERTYKK